MCNNAPVSVELARIWRDSAGKQYFSSGEFFDPQIQYCSSPSAAPAKRAKAGAALVEVIDIPLMGTDRPDTLMRVAMVLIAGKASNAMGRGPCTDSVLGGCDYSKGLLCCGLLKDSVMEQAIAPPGLAPWLWRHENTILVNMGELLTWIGSVKTRKTRKGTTVDFFCLELHRILWTVGWHSFSFSVRF